MKYSGAWSANRGCTLPAYGTVYESNNKHALARMMRETAQGETYVGNTGKWAIYCKSNLMRPILSGTVHGYKRR